VFDFLAALPHFQLAVVRAGVASFPLASTPHPYTGMSKCAVVLRVNFYDHTPLPTLEGIEEALDISVDSCLTMARSGFKMCAPFQKPTQAQLDERVEEVQRILSLYCEDSEQFAECARVYVVGDAPPDFYIALGVCIGRRDHAFETHYACVPPKRTQTPVLLKIPRTTSRHSPVSDEHPNIPAQLPEQCI